MAYTPPERRVTINPGQKIVGKSGEKLVIVIRSPRCILDGHSHIENGACAPLPLIWNRPWVPDVERAALNVMMKMAMPAVGNLQVKSTAEIGAQAAQELDLAFGPQSVIGSSDFYRNCDLFSFTVIQTMDMEYAWIGGFDGRTIYVYDDPYGKWYYYKRENPYELKDEWKKLVPGENQKTFSDWKKQIQETTDAITNNPLRLFAMYHYDPRRWNFPKNHVFDEDLIKGPWNYPFNEIIGIGEKGLFIGFKLYPPLGYKPLDSRLPYLHDKSLDGDCFYAYCEREGIPILAHCSPGGMSTHEMELYMQYDGKSSTPATDDAMPKETAKRLLSPEGYFWTNYVHPKNWREVLVRFPKLKLCLAHFGGDEWKRGIDSDWITEIIDLTREYDNVYTDFSCWDIDNAKEAFADILSGKQYAHLKKKVLFGTDWYMTLLVLNGKSYRKFCEEFWEFFQEIPNGMDLWERFTFVNPFKFYGIFDKTTGGKDKLECLRSALAKMKCNKKSLNDNYKSIRRVQQYYERIKDK